jgi:hypothetical protein
VQGSVAQVDGDHGSIRFRYAACWDPVVLNVPRARRMRRARTSAGIRRPIGVPTAGVGNPSRLPRSCPAQERKLRSRDRCWGMSKGERGW